MNGFEGDLREKILGSNAHLRITRVDGDFTEYRDVDAQVRTVAGVEGTSPFLTSEVAIGSTSNYQSVIIKGVQPERLAEVTQLGDKLDEGGFERMVGADAAAPAAKVGFVDLQTTIDKTKVGRKAKKNFDAAVKKKQAEFKKKENKLKQTSAELQKKANSLSPDERRKRQGELEKQYVELQEMYVKIQRDLAQQQAKLLDSIFTKAAPHIKAIAERDGYTIVFEKTQSALLWGDPGVDLTAEVNKKL